MLIDGVTVKGSYHNINQDSFMVRVLDKGCVLALSDGLGSKPNSHTGSKAVCESVIETAEALAEDLCEIDPVEFIKRVHRLWLEKLEGFDANDCMATVLIFVIYQGRAFAVRLGDGFISIWSDVELKVLSDKKADYFANETDCFTEELNTDRLEIYEADITELYGVILCSDGVGVGDMSEDDISGFTREFTEGYCEMKTEEISRDIQSWLSDWTGNDDKTLAYYLSERG